MDEHTVKAIHDFVRKLEQRFSKEDWYRFVGIGGETGKECVYLYAKRKPDPAMIPEKTEFPIIVRVIGPIKPVR